MFVPELKDKDQIRKLWWLHDSFWHAALVRELGVERANRINIETTEKISRMLTNLLLRQKIITRPQSIQDLMQVFKCFWKNAFFDGLYLKEPIEYLKNEAVWIGTRCHAYEALRKANMLDRYECGCQGVRNGVMKALRLKPVHEIKESLVKGHGRCVIRIAFCPKNT
jgi:hypothetical protein